MIRGRTNRAATQPRRMLDHDEGAIYCGLSFANFDRLVAEGRLPKPVELHGEVIWDIHLVDKALDRLTGQRRNSFH